jgi:nitrate reductase delta subunit
MTPFDALAPLFRYPDERYAAKVGVAQTLLSVPELGSFAEEIALLDLKSQQAAYTSTFDLAPSCSPYVGVHLFGDENRDRARLMLGLRSSYAGLGMDTNGGELPDHIAEVLAFAARVDGEEAGELRRFILVPALKKMDEILRPTSNPFRHLVSAALHSANGGGS